MKVLQFIQYYNMFLKQNKCMFNIHMQPTVNSFGGPN